MPEDKLTRDDLVLLMESYRNMITMHQAILDQTGRAAEKLNNLIKEQNLFLSSQDNMSKKISDLSGDISKIGEKINSHVNKTTENHGQVVNKIHVGWIGMGTIITGLIGLAVALVKLIP